MVSWTSPVKGRLCFRLSRAPRRQRHAGVGLRQARRGPVFVPARERRRRREVGGVQLRRRRAARGDPRAAAARSRSCAPSRATASEVAERRREPRSRRLPRARCARAAPAVPPGLPRFFGGAVGWLGYDVVRALREAARAARPTSWTCPTLCFVLTDTLVIFDNLRRTLKVVGRGRRRRAGDPEARLRRACARIDAVIERLARAAPPLRAARTDGRAGDVPAAAALDATQALRGRRARASRSTSSPATPSRSCCRSASRCRAPGATVRRLPRAARDQPVAVHVPPRVPRGGGHRRLARDAGARSTDGASRCGRSPARGRAAPPPRRTSALEAELLRRPEGARRARDADRPRPQRRRAGVARRHRCASTSRWWSSATRTSCTWSRTSRARCADGQDAARRAARCVPGRHAVAARRRSARWRSSTSWSRQRRGIYGGAVGYFGYTGNIDLAIAIRTLVTKGDTIYVQAGAGIVADSVPEPSTRRA